MLATTVKLSWTADTRGWMQGSFPSEANSIMTRIKPAGLRWCYIIIFLGSRLKLFSFLIKLLADGDMVCPECPALLTWCIIKIVKISQCYLMNIFQPAWWVSVSWCQEGFTQDLIVAQHLRPGYWNLWNIELCQRFARDDILLSSILTQMYEKEVANFLII